MKKGWCLDCPFLCIEVGRNKNFLEDKNFPAKLFHICDDASHSLFFLFFSSFFPEAVDAMIMDSNLLWHSVPMIDCAYFIAVRTLSIFFKKHYVLRPQPGHIYCLYRSLRSNHFMKRRFCTQAR